MKLHTIVFAGLALVTAAAGARGYFPQPVYGGMPQRMEAAGPALILEQGLARLLAFSGREQRPDEAQIARFLEREVAPHFDFAYMTRWAAGRMWPRMDARQRTEMEARLRQMFLGSLAARLLNYRGQRVRVGQPRRARGNELQVPVEILNPQGYPARLNFRFYRSAQGWKVFDVSANGSSALMHYRRYFRNAMRRSLSSGGRYPGGR